MKVTVIDEVPVIEVTVIEPTAGNHGTTMDTTTGKTTHTTTHATHVATAHAAHMATAARRTRPRRQHGQALQCRYEWYS